MKKAKKKQRHFQPPPVATIPIEFPLSMSCYNLIIADLRYRRAHLQAMIEYLEKLGEEKQ
jgi:hypothetical protein